MVASPRRYLWYDNLSGALAPTYQITTAIMQAPPQHKRAANGLQRLRPMDNQSPNYASEKTTGLTGSQDSCVRGAK